MGQINRLPIIIVSVTVAVLVVATILVPVISDSTSTIHDDKTNTTAPIMRFSEYKSTEDLVVTFDYSEKTITIGDVTIANPIDGTYKQSIYVLSDGIVIDGGSNYSFGATGFATDYNVNNTILGYDFTVTYSNGTATLVGGSDGTYTFTEDYTYLYIPDENGDWGYFSNLNVNVSDTSKVLFIFGGDHWASSYISDFGNPKEVLNGTFYSKPTNGSPMSGHEATFTSSYTENSGYVALSSFTITCEDSTDTTATYLAKRVFAPIDYYEITPDQKSLIDILNVIPILVIAGILVSLVAMVVIRKN